MYYSTLVADVTGSADVVPGTGFASAARNKHVYSLQNCNGALLHANITWACFCSGALSEQSGPLSTPVTISTSVL